MYTAKAVAIAALRLFMTFADPASFSPQLAMHTFQSKPKLDWLLDECPISLFALPAKAVGFK